MPHSELTAPKQSLVAIVDNLQALCAMVESSETEEEQLAAEAEIERVISEELAHKIDSIGWFMRRCDAEADLLKQMAADVKTGLDRQEHRKQRIRDAVQYAMQRTGTTKLKGSMFTAFIREGSESVDITDPQALPSFYERTIPATNVPDKNAIKSALKAGLEVPGAKLVRGAPSLQIR
jgi:hypothetical protein